MAATAFILGRKLIPDAFSDEGSKDEKCKWPDEMFFLMRALGFDYWTPRFVSKGTTDVITPNITVVTDLNWIKEVYRKAREEYGLQVISLGTPIGKSKLVDVDDGNPAKFMTREEVLNQTKRAIEVAYIMNATALRAFTFYGFAGRGKPDEGIEKAIDYMCAAADECKRARLLYVIEPETGLYGNNADNMISMMQKARSSGLENVVCITDLANLHIQALPAVAESRKLMESGFMVGAHIKAYGEPCPKPAAPSAEHTKLSHVPVGKDMNGTNYYSFFQDLGQRLGELNTQIGELRLIGYNYPGFVATLEPHLLGAGQFGGWSGPDGLVLARDALLNALKTYSIGCKYRRFEEFRETHGLPEIKN